MRLYWKYVLIFAILTLPLLFTQTVFAESPPNIPSDISWTDSGGTWHPNTGQGNASFTTTNDITTAFNNARRAEEAQLGLPSGCYGNLSLPSGYLLKSDEERGLILMNSERESRGGMCGTDSTVLGRPFESIEQNIQGLAQYYADYLVNNNATGHFADGMTPFERIANHPQIGDSACVGLEDSAQSNGYQFLPRAENIASLWTSGTENRMPIERAVFAWIYASKASGWGHREMVLLQNTDLTYEVYGFSDDFGQSGKEGFVGIGFAESPNYDPYNWGWVNHGTVVVMKYIDPQPQYVGCGYDYGVPTAVGMMGSSAEPAPQSPTRLQILPLTLWFLLLITITTFMPKQNN